MIEIPEAIVLAAQLKETLLGKTVKKVIANQSPHKFAWFFGDPQAYDDYLVGEVVAGTSTTASFVKIHFDSATLMFAEGIKLAFLTPGEKLPQKHQLLIEFEDESRLVASVQMYGGIWCYTEEPEIDFYKSALEKPTPLDDAFSFDYFKGLMMEDAVIKKSVKAALATEQRIPGLGNGVLQDILYNAKIHPKRKMNTLSDVEMEKLYASIKSTLHEMVMKGGRNTEKDIFSCSGGYKSKMSKLTKGEPCPLCGTSIQKMAYMGGSVYVCEGCQPLK